jgi:hypothetical protein
LTAFRSVRTIVNVKGREFTRLPKSDMGDIAYNPAAPEVGSTRRTAFHRKSAELPREAAMEAEEGGSCNRVFGAVVGRDVSWVFYGIALPVMALVRNLRISLPWRDKESHLADGDESWH